MVNKITLDKLQKIVDIHLKRELDIFEYVFHLNDQDLQKFRQWYINHPYCKIIDEVKTIVRTRAGTRKSKKDGNGEQEFDCTNWCD
jgi:hypothetical protein